MKHVFDVVVSAVGLLLLSPLLAVLLFLVWRQDGHSPFYLGERAACGGRTFKMVKIRSMVINADRTGVESTGAADNRITPLGHFIRRWKLDEIPQLWNVLKGEMSLVGPRPNTVREVTTRYTELERKQLLVRPGITDLASIVFSDEGEILRDTADPDDAYDKLIRPRKSALGLFYVEHQSFFLDLRIIFLTITAIFSRDRALNGVVSILKQNGAGADLIEFASRNAPLNPMPPPGSPVRIVGQ